MKKFLIILAGICLAAAGLSGAGTAEDAGPVLEEKALELAGSVLRFPAVRFSAACWTRKAL